MKTYDLTIAYRIYPKVSKVPPVFVDDKYKLSAFCLDSFKKALGKLEVKMIVFLDNCPENYKALFNQYFDQEDLILIDLPGVGNQETFNLQINQLIEQTYSEIVYFAEDDYFYIDDAIKEMFDLLRNNESVDFVTPYDHLDNYHLEVHNYKSFILATEIRHWRSNASTCLTFMTRKQILKETKDVFLTYVDNKCTDAALWFALTKQWLFEPLKFINQAIMKKDRVFSNIVRHAWYYAFYRVLFGKKYSLYSPMPSVAIHLENNYLPPTKALIDKMKMAEKDFVI